MENLGILKLVEGLKVLRECKESVPFLNYIDILF